MQINPLCHSITLAWNTCSIFAQLTLVLNAMISGLIILYWINLAIYGMFGPGANSKEEEAHLMNKLMY